MKKTLKKSLVKRFFTNLENLKLVLGHLYQNHITEQKWKWHITFQSIIQKCQIDHHKSKNCIIWWKCFAKIGIISITQIFSTTPWNAVLNIFSLDDTLANQNEKRRYFYLHHHNHKWRVYLFCSRKRCDFFFTSQWRHNGWRLKSPASRFFTQQFLQAHIKENHIGPHHWPLWGEFTVDRWIPHRKGQ